MSEQTTIAPRKSQARKIDEPTQQTLTPADPAQEEPASKLPTLPPAPVWKVCGQDFGLAAASPRITQTAGSVLFQVGLEMPGGKIPDLSWQITERLAEKVQAVEAVKAASDEFKRLADQHNGHLETYHKAEARLREIGTITEDPTLLAQPDFAAQASKLTEERDGLLNQTKENKAALELLAPHLAKARKKLIDATGDALRDVWQHMLTEQQARRREQLGTIAEAISTYLGPLVAIEGVLQYLQNHQPVEALSSCLPFRLVAEDAQIVSAKGLKL